MNPDVNVEYLSDTAVRLTCLLEAPADRVYRAWTSPAEIARWFVPATGARSEAPEMDVRVGGKYTLIITNAGVEHCTRGEYLALEPDRLIRFSWQGTCGTDEDGVSEVTVELAPAGGRTRLTLTHERLANIESRDRHAHGWTGCLTGLTRYMATR